ncbi:MerR family transcriptional regulator [Paenibacillus motobuensis]
MRLYEKQGIIRPLKDHSNNYRYYNDLDVRSLLMSRLYRSFYFRP